jgi:uncharacterized protein (UPF0332 family)
LKVTAMNPEDVEQALAKASRLLQVAEWAIEHELYDGAALCCYAALFWAVIAALAHQGIRREEWAHGFLWKTFREELVLKRRLYPPIFVEWLEKAYDLRNKAHYEITEPGAKVVRRIIRHAREFISRVQEVTKR